MPTVPSREAIAAYLPERVETALSTFVMRAHGEGLSHQQRRAVAEFVTGSPPGTLRDPLEVIPADAWCARVSNVANPLAGAAWNGWGAGADNRRFQSAAAAGLSRADVPRLRLRWAFAAPGVVDSGSQATVVGARVFFGTRNGMVYSLDTRSGCIAWAFQAEAGVRSTPVVMDDDESSSVYFGDSFANAYALDALTGELRWSVKLDEHPAALITGGSVYQDGRIYIPISSIEESTALDPTYECCTFRGSLVALDAASGQEEWRTSMIARGAEPTGTNSLGMQRWGPSGSAVWSAPSIDAENNRIYVATGDNYSDPPVSTSDAIMALELDTGRIVWTQQTLPGDAWNLTCIAGGENTFNCPESEGPDYDFGSSPVLVTRSDGSQVLLAGQKSGVLYGLDPEDGDLLWERRVTEGGVLGGIEWGFATDGDAAYVARSGAFELPPGEAGGLTAVDLYDGSIIWEAPPAQGSCANRVPGCGTGQPAAVSVIPGVVFSGSLDGHLRAYDASSGKVIWDYDTVRDFDTVNGVPGFGGGMNGPGATIAGGMVFVNSGYATFGFMPGNVLLAFSTE
jgi:polyvinyl alcohol dehydrogenase (cytochrome)